MVSPNKPLASGDTPAHRSVDRPRAAVAATTREPDQEALLDESAPDGVAEADTPTTTGLDRSFVVTNATNIAIAATNLVTGLALAHILGPDKRGILAAIISWPMILAVFGTAGLTEAIAYYTARQPERAREFYAVAISICVPISILLASVGWVLMPWLLNAQTARTVTVSRWLLLFCPLATVVAASEGCLRGLKRFGAWNAYRVVWPLAWLLVIIAAVVTHTRSPLFLAVGFAITRGVGALPVFLWFLVGLPGRLHITGRVGRLLLRYGLPGFFTMLPMVLNSRLDQLLLAGFIDSRLLGLYVISVAWASIGTIPSQSLAGLILPRLASISSEREQRDAFVTSSRLAVTLALISAVPVLVATPVVLPLLFGSAFKQAVPTASVLVLAAVFTSWNAVMEDAARGLGSPKTVLWAEGAGLVITLAALAALLKPLGLMGAALSSVMGYGAVSAALLLYAKRVSGGVAMRLLLVPRRDDFSALSPAALRTRLRDRSSRSRQR